MFKFKDKWYKVKIIHVFHLLIPNEGEANEIFFKYDDVEYKHKPREITNDIDADYYWLLLKDKPKIIEPYKCMFIFHLDFAKHWGICIGSERTVIDFDLHDFYYKSVGVYFIDEEVREKWGKLYDEEAESLKGRQ